MAAGSCQLDRATAKSRARAAVGAGRLVSALRLGVAWIDRPPNTQEEQDVQALRDPSGAVREGAAAALAAVGGEFAVEALTAAAEGDGDPWVRERARLALREILDE